jgi:hypothetical protein
MTNIAILEDRRSYADDLAHNIRREIPGADVSIFNEVDSAIKAVASGEVLWNLWVVDLMLPTGHKFTRAETRNGLSTGSRFIDMLIEGAEGIDFGIFVITSRETDSDRFGDKEVKIFECQKGDHTQVEIARLIRQALG